MQSLVILGRQPALGIAEVESLYGADKVTPIGGFAAGLDVDPCSVAFYRLGGSTRLAKVLTILPYIDWKKIENFLIETVPQHLQYVPEGKFTLGLSVYGLDISPSRLNATGLTLKKVARAAGRGTRVVQGNTLELSAAQVIHNQLTSDRAWELLFIKDGTSTVVAQTMVIQDIEAYSKRDQARPKRDAKVGMLPPKLAQIILNLATGPLPESQTTGECLPVNPRVRPLIPNATVLDPFCGTGVMLQEAMLMGYNSIGTDLEPRMVEYSKANIDWLKNLYTLEASAEFAVMDATNATFPTGFTTIAAETYLGRPFSAPPTAQVLSETISTTSGILKAFLQNVAHQTKPGFRLALAVPAWSTGKNQFKHLPILDRLTDMGYNRLSFVHAENKDLIYHREGQIVARELVVLVRF